MSIEKIKTYEGWSEVIKSNENDLETVKVTKLNVIYSDFDDVIDIENIKKRMIHSKDYIDGVILKDQNKLLKTSGFVSGDGFGAFIYLNEIIHTEIIYRHIHDPTK